MEGVNMHDLRHSLASALISQGETLSVVGKALGMPVSKHGPLCPPLP